VNPIPNRLARVLLALGTVAALALSGAAPAAAKPRDTDGDGMPDRWEKAHHLNWRKANARGDPDRDGITNLREYRLGLNPRRADGQCSELQKALGATDPSECGSASLTMVLR
jgi:hypothetical protein